MKTCVIVLCYNGKQHLKACLSSLARQSYKDFWVILADNGSTDGSVEFARKNFGNLKGLEIMEHGKNYGFAKGNNLAARKALIKGAKHLVFLNQDTEVDPNWLKNLVKAAESDPAIGACASKALLFDRRGTLDYGGGGISYLGFGYSIGADEKDHNQYAGREIAMACGGYFLLKREAAEKVGLFDDDYFLYCEDIDLSWRLMMAGYRIIFVPESVVYHKYHPAKFSKTKLYYLERNRLTTLIKNYSLRSLLLIFPMLIFIEFSSMAYALMTGWFREKILGYCWNLRMLRKTFMKRAEIQAKRKVSDKIATRLFSGRLDFKGTDNPLLEGFLNPLVAKYWNSVKKLI